MPLFSLMCMRFGAVAQERASVACWLGGRRLKLVALLLKGSSAADAPPSSCLALMHDDDEEQPEPSARRAPWLREREAARRELSDESDQELERSVHGEEEEERSAVGGESSEEAWPAEEEDKEKSLQNSEEEKQTLSGSDAEPSPVPEYGGVRSHSSAASLPRASSSTQTSDVGTLRPEAAESAQLEPVHEALKARPGMRATHELTADTALRSRCSTPSMLLIRASVFCQSRRSSSSALACQLSGGHRLRAHGKRLCSACPLATFLSHLHAPWLLRPRALRRLRLRTRGSGAHAT